MSKAKENESLTFQQLLSVVEWLASKDESDGQELRGIYRFVPLTSGLLLLQEPPP